MNAFPVLLCIKFPRCAGVAAGAATAGVAAAAQLPKGLGSLVMQTFALRGLPVYVPLTVPSVSVAVDCPGELTSPLTCSTLRCPRTTLCSTCSCANVTVLAAYECMPAKMNDHTVSPCLTQG